MMKLLTELLLLQLLLYTAQSVNSSPPSRQHSSNKQREPVNDIGRELPDDLDLNTTPLKDMVDMKPKVWYTAKGRLYKDYFANHPEVRKINLHDSDHGKTTQALINLSNKEDHDRSWKTRMAASVKNLIKDTEMDESLKKKIKDTLRGQSYRTSIRSGHQRYVQRLGPEEVKKNRKEAAARYKAEYGIKYGQKTRELQEKNPLMNQPLSVHLDKEGKTLSPWEVEEKARQLSHLYTGPSPLTRQLKKYLSDNDVSPKDYAAVMGIRATTVSQQARDKRRLKKAMNASTSNTSMQTPILQHHPLPEVSPSRQMEGVHVDPNDESEWDWFHNYLKD